MIKVPFSGGPNSGKSTLIEASGQLYPESHILGEPAANIIPSERAKKEADPEYEAILPATKPLLFDRMVIAKYLEQEATVDGKKGLTFQDRSLWDSVAYCRLAGNEELASVVEKQAKAANYAFAFFCELVGTYTPNGVRSSGAESAAIKHEALREVYEASGLTVITLPPVSLEARLQIVQSTISEIL